MASARRERLNNALSNLNNMLVSNYQASPYYSADEDEETTKQNARYYYQAQHFDEFAEAQERELRSLSKMVGDLKTGGAGKYDYAYGLTYKRLTDQINKAKESAKTWSEQMGKYTSSAARMQAWNNSTNANYSKIQEALNGYKNYWDQFTPKQGSIKVQKGATDADIRNAYTTAAEQNWFDYHMTSTYEPQYNGRGNLVRGIDTKVSLDKTIDRLEKQGNTREAQWLRDHDTDYMTESELATALAKAKEERDAKKATTKPDYSGISDINKNPGYDPVKNPVGSFLGAIFGAAGRAIDANQERDAKISEDVVKYEAGLQRFRVKAIQNNSELRRLLGQRKAKSDELSLGGLGSSALGKEIAAIDSQIEQLGYDPSVYAEAYEKHINQNAAEKIADMAVTNRFTAGVATAVTSALSPLRAPGGILATASKLVGEEVDPDDRAFLFNNISSAIRNRVSEVYAANDLDWNIELFGKQYNAGTFFYNTTVSALDSAANMLLAKGLTYGMNLPTIAQANKWTTNLTQLLMSSEVYTDELINAKRNGWSDAKAIAWAATKGIIEAATEKYSIEEILKPSAGVFRQLGKAFLAEGSEEVTGNILETVADVVYNGDKSEIMSNYYRARNNGASESKAAMQALGGFMLDNAEAFLSGGLSGMAMGATGTGAQLYNDSRTGKNITVKGVTDDVLQTAVRLNLDDNADLAKRIAQAQARQRAEKSAGNIRLGQIARLGAEQASKQEAQAAVETMTQQLVEQGLSETSAAAAAEAYVKHITGQELTKADKKTLRNMETEQQDAQKTRAHASELNEVLTDADRAFKKAVVRQMGGSVEGKSAQTISDAVATAARDYDGTVTQKMMHVVQNSLIADSQARTTTQEAITRANMEQMLGTGSEAVQKLQQKQASARDAYDTLAENIYQGRAAEKAEEAQEAKQKLEDRRTVETIAAAVNKTGVNDQSVRVLSAGKGKITLQLADGTQVTTTSKSIGEQKTNLNPGERAILTTAAQLRSAEDANAMIYYAQYADEPVAFASQYLSVYNRAARGDAKAGVRAENAGLSQRAFEAAYASGQTNSQDVIRVGGLKMQGRAGIGNYSPRAGKRGGVTDLTSAKGKQEYVERGGSRMQIDMTMDVLRDRGKKYGIDYVLVDSIGGNNGNGKGTHANGHYDGDHTIYIAMNGDSPLLTAASHETYHYFKQKNRASAMKLQNYIIDALQDDSVMGAEAYAKMHARLADAYKDLTAKLSEREREDYIREEIAANSVFDVFSNEKAIRALHKSDPGLFGALKARITDFISDLKRHMERAFGGGSGSYTAPVARALSENVERMETIRRMFDEIGEEVAEQVREPGRRAFADALRGQLDRRVQATAADEAAKWDKDHSYVPFSEVKAVGRQSRVSGREDAQATVTQEYQGIVDLILANKYTSKDAVLIGYTPDVYQKLGMPSLPFVIGPGHIYSAIKSEAEAKAEGRYRKGTNYHGLGENVLKNIYQALDQPVLIIASKDNSKNAIQMRSKHSIVSIVDVGNAGQSLLLPIEISAERRVSGATMDVNVLSSAYNKSIKELVREAVAQENIGDVGIFYAKKEAAQLIPGGVQFPRPVQRAMASDGIVHHLSEKINMRIADQTQSLQFKRWFGNSKVVNPDGTPKVVYHQTAHDFWTFNTNNPVAGQYDSETPNGIFFKDNDHDIGIGGSRQIAVYLRMEKPLRFANRGEANRWYRTHIKGYAALADEQKAALEPISDEMDEIENRMFAAGVTDEEYDTLDKQWNDLLAKMKSVEDGYSSRLRDLLNDYFIKNDSGYDGIILDYDGHRYVDGKRENVKSYIVFKNTQIKSATDNIGTFDGTNPDIRFSLAGTKSETAEKSRLAEAQDAAYLAAVERGDMETTDSMVRSAAKKWGAASDERGRVVDLYHGTSEMGFTVFEANRTKSSEGLIYTTTKSNVAANYGGRNNYAGVRMIGRKFIENATKTGDIIQNAETILNRKFKVASQPDRQKVIDHVTADAQRLSDRFNDLYDDGSVSAFLSVEGASELYDRRLCNIDFVLGAVATPGDYYDPEYATAEEYRREAKAAYEAYKEARRFIDEHREDIVRAGGKPVADFYQSFDVGDTLVDIEYRYTKAIDNDHEVVISNGRDWLSTRIDYPADLQRVMEETHKIGSYHLFGNLGSKPLIVDAGKATDWLSVPVPDELNVVHGWATDDGTKYSSTDQIAKTAKAAGYTAVVIKNVYDGGDMADDYIFFDSSQLKSADPVTYDDAGNVIPLSERFNEEKTDIRFSRMSEDAQPKQLAPVFYSQLERAIDNMKMDKIGASSVVSFLKGRGVKDEEIKWSGLIPYLDGKKSVAKAELQRVLAESRVEVQQRTLDTDYDENDYVAYEAAEQRVAAMAYDRIDEEMLDIDIDSVRVEYEDDNGFAAYGEDSFGEIVELARINPEKRAHHWSDYKLDGGENYREYLYRLPDSEYTNDAMRVHWKGVKGVLAHARVQDMQHSVTDEAANNAYIETKNRANAERDEFLANMPPAAEAGADALMHSRLYSFTDRYDAARQLYRTLYESSLDAIQPLIYIAHRLGLNDAQRVELVGWAREVKALENRLRQELDPARKAADPMEKRVLFVEEIQSDWHNAGQKGGFGSDVDIPALEKNRDEIRTRYVDLNSEYDRCIRKRFRKEELTADEKGIIAEYDYLRNELYELDQRIRRAYLNAPDAPYAGEADSYVPFVLKNLIREAAESGYDYIGWTTAQQQSDRWSEAYAEGYRIEYDQEIPKFLKKYGKQWGATVQDITLDSGDTVHAMTITDAMRDSVLYEGQPKFSLKSSRIAADSAFAYTATAKENEELRKTVASLSRALEKTRRQLNAAKRETVQTRSSGITDRFDARARNQLYTLAGRYIREADSTMDQKELADRLEMVLQSVFNTEYGHLGDDTMNALADIGYDMLRQKKRHRATDTRSEFKREARRVTYYINPEEQKNLADHYGSWKNFREAARAHGVTYTTNKTYARNGKAALGIGELLQMSESNGDGYDIEHSILFDWSDGTFDVDMSGAVPDAVDFFEALFGFMDGTMSGSAGMTEEDVYADEYDWWLGEQKKELARAADAGDQYRVEEIEAELYGGVRAAEATDFAVRVLSDALEYVELPTFADVKASELKAAQNALGAEKKAHAKTRQSMEKEAERLNSELKSAREAMRQTTAKMAEAAQQAKTEQAEAVAEARKTGRLQERHRIENRDSKRALRKKIRDNVKRLDARLRAPKDAAFIPDELRGVVRSFVDEFLNDTSVFDRKTLATIAADYARLNSDEEEGVIYDAQIATWLDELRDDLPALAETFDTVEPTERNKYSKLTRMNLEQLQKVSDIAEHFAFIISQSNKIFFAGRSEQRHAVCRPDMDRFRKKGVKLRRGFGATDAADRTRSGVKSYMVKEMIPIYFFERLGGNAQQIWYDVENGQAEWGLAARRAAIWWDELTGRHKDSASWWKDKKENRLNVTLDSGENITLTRDEVLALYATYKREETSGFKTNHILGGGIRITHKIDVVQDGKKGSVRNAEPYKLTENDLSKILDFLTDEQKVFADEAVGYLSGELADRANETSRAISGYSKFLEPYYFPFKSDPALRGRSVDEEQNKAQAALIKNKGFTVSTTANANSPLLLGSFTDIWESHVSDILMYTHMAIPQTAMAQWFNYKVRDVNADTGEKENAKTMRAALDNAYGKEYTDYIDTLLRDMSGSVTSDGAVDLLEKGLSSFKKMAVFANMSVVIQQPSAYLRAMAEVNPKYFAALPKTFRTKSQWKEMMQYSGVTVLKDIGGFDMNNGRGLNGYITDKDGLRQKLDDAMGAGAEIADKVTWVYMWQAVKKETAAKTGLKGEELLQAAGKRFDYVMEKTQVYDSKINKSAFMRSQNTLAKIATSFMAEPTKSFNMLMQGVYKMHDAETKTDKTAGMKLLARSVTAFVAASVLNELLQSIIGAMRDKDEDRTLWEKYLANFSENMLTDLWIPSMLPYFRDVTSIMQGYDATRSDLSPVTALYDAIEQTAKAASGSGDWQKALISDANILGILTGIPAKNLSRLYTSFINLTKNTAYNVPEGQTNLRIRATLNEALDNFLPTFLRDYIGESFENYGAVVDALVDGDNDRAEQQKDDIRAYLAIRGKPDAEEQNKRINTKLKAELKSRVLSESVEDKDAIRILEDELGVKKGYEQLLEWKNGSNSKWASLVPYATNFMHGDYKAYMEGVQTLISNGMESDQAVKKIGEIVDKVKAAAQAKVDGDEDAYDDLVAELTENYLYSPSQLEKDIASFTHLTKSQPKEESTGTGYKTGYTYDDLGEAYIIGDTARYNMIREDMKKTGRTDKTIDGYLTSQIKAAYNAGQIDRSRAEAYLKSKGFTGADLTLEMRKWDGKGDTYDTIKNVVAPYIEKGGSLAEVQKEVEFLINEVKKDKSDVIRALAGVYKPKYVAAVNSGDYTTAANIKSRFIAVAVLLGYTESYENKYINKNWK